MDELHTMLMASMGDVDGPKYQNKPTFLEKFCLLDQDITDVMEILNKGDPNEVQDFILMVCNNLNNLTTFPLEICDNLIIDHPVASSYRMAGDMAFTDVEVSRTSIVILALLFSLELVFSLLGNSMVLLIFTCSRPMRSITNFFIVSLAASDLLMTVSSIPLNLAQVLTGFWQFGSTVCKLGPFTAQLSVAASSLTLCCIALDRYIAVVHPLRLSTMQNPRRAALLMTVVWLVATGAASPFVYYNQMLTLCEWPSGECALYCGMPASLRWLHWLTYVVLLIVPMLLMGLIYAIIIFMLWMRQPVGSTAMGVESLRIQYKKKAIKMLFLVMVIFTSCWTPLLTFDLLAKLLHWPLKQSLVTARYYLQCLALSGTCLNPMVYAIMHDKFRRNFRKLCILCPQGVTKRTKVTPLGVRGTPAAIGGIRPVARSPIIVQSALGSSVHGDIADEQGGVNVFQVKVV